MKTQTAAHTPKTKWQILDATIYALNDKGDSNDVYFLIQTQPRNWEREIKIAQDIHRAVNAHQELVEALKEIVAIASGDAVSVDDIFAIQEMAESALAKAEKGKE